MMQRKHAVLGGVSVLGFAILGYAALSERSEAPRKVEAALPSAAPVQALGAASAVPVGTAAPAVPARSPEQILEQTCPGEKAKDCACRKGAVLSAFEHPSDLASATDLAQRSGAECPGGELSGLAAEGLSRLGRAEEAAQAARETLTRLPRNPYAAYAEALSAYRANQHESARAAAQRAASFGRGAPADVLLGMIEYGQKNFEQAERLFQRAMDADPKSSDAVFNMAVLHQRRNNYDRARGGYLKALALNPTHHDARYNLVLLTLGAGAGDEARHHFAKLKASVGASDARVSRLADRFAAPAPVTSGSELRLKSSRP
jgi:tetratricopeptide (TPR) repeat protein